MFCLLYVYAVYQLINGDVAPSFRHRGYKQEQKVTVTSRRLALKSKEQAWLEDIAEIIDEVYSALLPLIYDVFYLKVIVNDYSDSEHFLIRLKTLILPDTMQSGMLSY